MVFSEPQLKSKRLDARYTYTDTINYTLLYFLGIVLYQSRQNSDFINITSLSLFIEL
jgi:surface polysaccharide O-acyltransferase-like enzyme